MGSKCSATEVKNGERVLSNPLSTVISGSPSRGNIVLIHAFPLDHRLWQHLLKHPPEGYRVLAMDLPGFGFTPLDVVGNENAYELDTLGDLIAATSKSHGVERAIFAGCSMGGYACFSMLRNHRQMIEGLLLADTRATADTQVAREGRMQLVSAIEQGGIKPVLESMPGRLLGKTTMQESPAIVAEIRSIIQDQPPLALTAALRAMASRKDSTDLLGSIDVPVTVVVGAEDALVSVEEARAMANLIPQSELEVLDSVGHLPSIEAPDFFARIVRQLADRVATVN